MLRAFCFTMRCVNIRLCRIQCVVAVSVNYVYRLWGSQLLRCILCVLLPCSNPIFTGRRSDVRLGGILWNSQRPIHRTPHMYKGPKSLWYPAVQSKCCILAGMGMEPQLEDLSYSQSNGKYGSLPLTNDMHTSRHYSMAGQSDSKRKSVIVQTDPALTDQSGKRCRAIACARFSLLLWMPQSEDISLSSCDSVVNRHCRLRLDARRGVGHLHRLGLSIGTALLLSDCIEKYRCLDLCVC